MNSKTGICIDREKAVIVSLFPNETLVKTIYSGLKKDEKKHNTVFNSLESEKAIEPPMRSEIMQYLESIISTLQDIHSLVLFGPADMKVELQKQISKYPSLKRSVKDVCTTNSMPDNQLVAWVIDYFKP